MADADTAKYFGRVYTPAWVVQHMLQPLLDTSLRAVCVCDPACGVGDFLVPIAEEVCRRARKDPGRQPEYESTLKALTGYEVDKDAVAECRRRLSDVTERVLGTRFPVDYWAVHQGDALDAWECDQGRFDWVVGNPPYVRIQHLEEERRDKIRRGDWQFFHGSSDLYIVFYELGLRLLKEGGNLVFIAPSGWMRNGAGRALRRSLMAKHSVVSVHDFRDYQVFPAVSTYTCIAHLVKGKHDIAPAAHWWDGAQFKRAEQLAQRESQWAVVSAPSEQANNSQKTVPLNAIADIHVGIQTLADKVFILERLWLEDGILVCSAGGRYVRLEPKAVRRILKASVMKGDKDPVSRVIVFPYSREGDLLPEDEFRSRFPLAYAWLSANKERLLARDKGTFSRSRWYAFGRQVGIRNGFGSKILTSSMNAKPNFQVCRDKAALFYAGYCVKPRIDIDLGTLQGQLNSSAMDHHIRTFSQPFRGGWYSYAKRYIQDFPVPRDAVGGLPS